MTLSLDDVRNKRFRMARKGGYEVLEVDEFVDEVEESFAQLTEENASLKKQVEALRSSGGEQAGDRTAPAAETAPASSPAPVAETTSAPQAVAAPQQSSAPAQLDRVVVTTSAEASTAVVRLVQLSTEQAEHLVREAEEEAARVREDAERDASQVTEDARTRADRLESEARVNAERLQSEAQGRSESLDRDLAQRRVELFGDLDRQRDTLTGTVARLRDFEQRYRSNLADHLRGQLDDLQQVGFEPEGGPERTEPRPTGSATATSSSVEGPESTGGTAPTASGGSGTADGGDAQASPSSDTPRLDALLGDQR